LHEYNHADEKRVAEILKEAYRLRDAVGRPDEREFYQEHVYRLRPEEYRSSNIDTKKPVRGWERGRRRAEVLPAEAREARVKSKRGALLLVDAHVRQKLKG
jgi:hypothetical protein